MRQFLKFFVALLIAMVVVVAVRMFAFTIYTSPVAIGKSLKAGEKVMVNKFSRNENFSRGDLIVFTVSGEAPAFELVGKPKMLGLINAIPGDTVKIGRQRYRIPYKCCDRCQCRDCRLYLVDTGNGSSLVHKHQIVGKALRIFK